MTNGFSALRNGAAWIDLSGRGRIVARGRDRARLLHNLTSNEVKKLTPGSGCYAFLLSPQGRIQADLNLFCFAEHFLLDTEAELREKVLLHIRKYIIADQVELEDVTGQTGCIGVEGPGSAAAMARLGAPVPDAGWAHAEWGGYTVAAAAASGQAGFRIFGADAPLIARLGLVEATAEDVRAMRIENGRPRYGEDIRETSLVQETEQMHAVSFTKGCYLGQEIVERVRAQGHVNKKLRRVELDLTEAPAAGTKMMVDGAEAEVTSAVVSPDSGKVVALAYVRVPRANTA